jgi:hypothetical protein
LAAHLPCKVGQQSKYVEGDNLHAPGLQGKIASSKQRIRQQNDNIAAHRVDNVHYIVGQTKNLSFMQSSSDVYDDIKTQMVLIET